MCGHNHISCYGFAVSQNVSTAVQGDGCTGLAFLVIRYSQINQLHYFVIGLLAICFLESFGIDSIFAAFLVVGILQCCAIQLNRINVTLNDELVICIFQGNLRELQVLARLVLDIECSRGPVRIELQGHSLVRSLGLNLVERGEEQLLGVHNGCRIIQVCILCAQVEGHQFARALVLESLIAIINISTFHHLRIGAPLAILAFTEDVVAQHGLAGNSSESHRVGNGCTKLVAILKAPLEVLILPSKARRGSLLHINGEVCAQQRTVAQAAGRLFLHKFVRCTSGKQSRECHRHQNMFCSHCNHLFF